MPSATKQGVFGIIREIRARGRLLRSLAIETPAAIEITSFSPTTEQISANTSSSCCGFTDKNRMSTFVAKSIFEAAIVISEYLSDQ